MLRQNPRTFVEDLDFRTTVGFLHGGRSREGLGVSGQGPAAVITDLGILEPDPESRELVLTTLHPGVKVDEVVEATGWTLHVAEKVGETLPPSATELEVLRSLKPSEDSDVGELIAARVGATAPLGDA